ncbi:zinc metalloprotease [Thermococcus peptonophilus]|uniref:hypothetical protein n=1 Tax=Thermococcus peptonophilus TaxID=53952 RepID=UPI000A6DE813
MILIVPPIGYIPPEWLIKDVAEFVDSYYSQRGVPVKAGSPLSESLFLSAYHPFRRQFLGGAFLPPMLSEIGRRQERWPQLESQKLTSTKGV